MKELDAKITLTKFLIAAVIIIGLFVSYSIAKPAIIETYERATRDTHLAGEVFTAKDLSVTVQPIRLFYDKWDASSGYDGDFVNDGYHFKHGIGWYIPSKTIANGSTGSTQLGLWLGGEFNEVYFNACTDTEWTPAYDGGTYRIICYVNGTVVHDTGFNDYTYSEEIKLDVSGANDLVIELQENKGSQGTLNVILGEFEINKLSE